MSGRDDERRSGGDYHDFSGFLAPSGEIRDPKLGGRVFLLAASAWAEMRNGLYESVSEPAGRALLWHMGKRYGFSLGSRAKAGVNSRAKALRLLAEMATYSGWGLVNLNGDLENGAKIEVEFRNCVFCFGVKDAKSPECHFLTGVISGIAEAVFGREFKVSEERCSAMNHEKCYFIVESR